MCVKKMSLFMAFCLASATSFVFAPRGGGGGKKNRDSKRTKNDGAAAVVKDSSFKAEVSKVMNDLDSAKSQKELNDIFKKLKEISKNIDQQDAEKQAKRNFLREQRNKIHEKKKQLPDDKSSSSKQNRRGADSKEGKRKRQKSK